MKKVLFIIITIVLVSMVLTGFVHANESGIPFTEDPEAMEQAARSVVKLEVFNNRDERIGTGSGFAAFDPAVLVTACHLIENMEYMIATRDDGTSFRIERANDADEDTDIALCELPEDTGLTALTCTEDKLLRGEKTVAIGSQFGLVNLVTLGKAHPGDRRRYGGEQFCRHNHGLHHKTDPGRRCRTSG